MGKIEYDVRMLMKVTDIPMDQAKIYIACAREFYSDFENRKGDAREEALNATTERWIERGFKPDIVKRIRTKVTEVYTTLKTPIHVVRPVLTDADLEDDGEQPA